jgi:hypothetical protein
MSLKRIFLSASGTVVLVSLSLFSATSGGIASSLSSLVSDWTLKDYYPSNSPYYFFVPNTYSRKRAFLYSSRIKLSTDSKYYRSRDDHLLDSTTRNEEELEIQMSRNIYLQTRELVQLKRIKARLELKKTQTAQRKLQSVEERIRVIETDIATMKNLLVPPPTLKKN